MLGSWLGFLQGIRQEFLFSLLLAIFASLVLASLGFAIIAFLFRLRNTWVARRWARVEHRLMDQLLAVLDGDQPPEALHRAVLRRERQTFVDLAARLARRLRGAERARLAGAVRPFLQPVVRRTGSRDAGLRAHAVQTLGLLNFEWYAHILVRALDDPDDIVAMTAARLLARREHVAYAPLVLARLQRFGHWDAAYLASMLAGIGPEVAPALDATLANPEQSPRARAVAAWALRALNHLPSGDTAARILASSTDRDLLASCLRLLRRVGQPHHIPVVRALVSSDDAVVRAQAIAALAALETPSALADLARYLDDPSPWVALETARALRQVAGGRLLRGLAEGAPRRAALAAQAFAEAAA